VPGYLNRFIDVDLSEEYGEGCHVRLHNPKVIPQSMLEPSKKVVVDADNKPVDREAAVAASDEVMCRLIKDWNVYDASCFEDEQPPLPLPATPELLAKLPLGVKLLLSKIITDAIPNPK
jgi:hypothetical protein